MKCHEEESCVDISHFSMRNRFRMIKAGQNRLHHSIPQHGILTKSRIWIQLVPN